MKRITVYADFDFLSAPQEIGTLGYEHVRGKDHFVFEYSRQWLKQHGGMSRIPSPIAGGVYCLTAESD